MSSLYPSLLNNQPAEEMEMQDYPNSGRFRLSLEVPATHRPCNWPYPLPTQCFCCCLLILPIRRKVASW